MKDDYRVDESRVHEIFDGLAGDYDRMNDIISFKLHDKYRARTMRAMNLTQQMSVLDACCGTGDWTLDLAGQVGQVVGLDFTRSMLDVAKSRARNLTNVTFVEGNVMQMPFKSDSFDLVTIGYGLRNTSDYLETLKEIFRVLKPGGQIVCIEMSHPTFPVYKQLYGLYLYRVMPVLGKVFAGKYKEYRWLQKSVKKFPGARDLAQLFEAAGFREVGYVRYSGGAVASHTGSK